MKAIIWNIIGLVFLFLLDATADALTPQIIEDEKDNGFVCPRTV